ncbi:MAG: DUF192 domain-containing protein [Candidatus Berkelbacteria bacterium]|nr:DUF192 domain-containing protein [Candidatus Berkelbacteria bacterium]
MKSLFRLLIVLVSLFLIYLRSINHPNLATATLTTAPPSTTFSVEIARTDYETQKGLMGRQSLCPTCGMLFIYDQEQTLSFWMRNTFIPLDLVWLDRQGQVVMTIEHAAPLRGIYTNTVPAQYVIELPAGAVQQYQLDHTKFVLRGIIE